MAVRVIGKAGCQKCEAAKKNLERLGVGYETHTIEFHSLPHPNWRTDGSAWVLAEYYAGGETLPVLQIDNKAYSYPAAMREIKRRLHAEKPEDQWAAVEDQPQH